ncbi:MAG: hypothetical protein Q9183_006059, partial [Haloplaca sp. 2 TL-2023]
TLLYLQLNPLKQKEASIGMETGLFYSDGTPFHTTTYLGISIMFDNPTITYVDLLLHLGAILFFILSCTGAIFTGTYLIIEHMNSSPRGPPEKEWLGISKEFDRVLGVLRASVNGGGAVDQEKEVYGKYMDDEAAVDGKAV